MGKRGGRTKTTMPKKSTWRSGKTKMIRVPEKLADEIIKIARIMDNGFDPVEYKLIQFELLKMKQYQRTKKPFDGSTPRWAVFNEFSLCLKKGYIKW